MLDIVLYIATSLDGYIATPDGCVDWLSELGAEAEDYGYDQFYGGVDALVMGRKTYEQVLTFGDWPYAGKPTYVMSRHQLQIEIPDIYGTTLSPLDLAKDLDRHYQRVWLVGGASAAASFRSAYLITEYFLSIMPVMLGDGIPLFSQTASKSNLALVNSDIFESGVVQLTYRVKSSDASVNNR
jgi:dihydrofolate reductase